MISAILFLYFTYTGLFFDRAELLWAAGVALFGILMTGPPPWLVKRAARRNWPRL